MEHLSISDLTKSQYFKDNIRWEVTPKVFLSPHIILEDGTKKNVDTTHGYMLYVDLVDNKPAIILMKLTEIMSRTIGYINEAPEELLREAMHCVKDKDECVAGMYPLTDKLENWLKKEFGIS